MGIWHSLYPQLPLFFDKWVLERSPIIHVLPPWLVWIILTRSLCAFVGLFSRRVLGSAVAQAFTFCEACTKVLLICLRGWVHPSHPEMGGVFLLFIGYVYKTSHVQYLWCLVRWYENIWCMFLFFKFGWFSALQEQNQYLICCFCSYIFAL